MTAPGCALCGAAQVDPVRGAFPADTPYVVLRCCGCGSERLDPIPGDKVLEEYYRQYHHSDVSWPTFLEMISAAAPMAARIGGPSSSIEQGRPGTFLDIGGASGFLACAMALRGWTASSQDVSDNAGKWIGEAERHFGFRVGHEKASIAELNASGRTYDLVNASQVLEHVQDPVAFLGALGALVKPGGRLTLDTPNNDALFWVFKNAVRGPFRRTDFYNSLKPPEHIWGYTLPGLRALAQRCGLEVLRITDYGAGDGRFQPASVFWYLSVAEYLRTFKRSHLTPYFLGKTALGVLDRRIFCPVAGRGSGLSAVLRRR